MEEHCATAKHIKSLEKKTATKGKCIHQVAMEKFDNSKKLGTLRPEVKDYRCKAIIAACKTNLPISQVIELGKCWVDEYSGCTLGSDTDIVNAFAKSVPLR